MSVVVVLAKDLARETFGVVQRSTRNGSVFGLVDQENE